ncbi:hypothetical protein JCM17843_17730 [Kordiimonadales bacterium JCM 17843]|nr:hypothetical protein JCM17843_17730 [Kordiimonadales bacterium JCM 17843]
MASTAAMHDRANEEREVFGAYICDEETAALLAPLAEEHGWLPERIHKGGVANAVRSLSVMRSPEFLIVDLSESGDPRADIGALADVCEPGTLVLAIGVMNDVHLYRDLLASGIHDYLLKPVDFGDLRESVALALSAMVEPEIQTPKKETTKRMVTVIGARGGVGASGLSSGLAWILADEFDTHVGLLDLDLNFGTDAMTFDLEPGRGLSDALENPNRVDSLFIERAMLKVSDKLSILGSEAPLGDPMTPDPAALQNLQEELAENFDVVLVDLPRSIASSYPLTLANASDVVLVTDLSLAATRDTIRLLSLIKPMPPPLRCIWWPIKSRRLSNRKCRKRISRHPSNARWIF